MMLFLLPGDRNEDDKREKGRWPLKMRGGVEVHAKTGIIPVVEEEVVGGGWQVRQEVATSMFGRPRLNELSSHC